MKKRYITPRMKVGEIELDKQILGASTINVDSGEGDGKDDAAIGIDYNWEDEDEIFHSSRK